MDTVSQYRQGELDAAWEAVREAEAEAAAVVAKARANASRVSGEIYAERMRMRLVNPSHDPEFARTHHGAGRESEGLMFVSEAKEPQE